LPGVLGRCGGAAERNSLVRRPPLSAVAGGFDLDQCGKKGTVTRFLQREHAMSHAAPASEIPVREIPGTTIFDGRQAMKGYALNKMCFSFNKAENREAFRRDEEGYMDKYGLNGEQKAAVRARNVLQLIEAGGNIYYLAKFAGIFGLNVQDVGAQQTGMSVEAFKDMLRRQGE
jgi:protocatechuate 4,5-dioxygenase alpha chain